MIDRLALLIDEVGHQKNILSAAAGRTFDEKSIPGPLVKDVVEFLGKRKPTVYIRAPHPVDVKVSLPFISLRLKESSKLYGEDSRWAPWEITSTNYLIDLQCLLQMQVTLEVPDEAARLDHHISKALTQCRQFFLPNFFLLTSWDDTLGNTIADWWNVEAVCLLAASIAEVMNRDL